MTTPGWSLPDPEAHLGDAGGVGVVDDGDRTAERPCASRSTTGKSTQAGSMLAAVLMTPPIVDARQPDADRGRRRRAGVRLGEPLDEPADRGDDRVGRRRVGVGTRRRSDTERPASTSTTAALMPLPPTSTPIASLGPASIMPRSALHDQK